MSKKSIIFLLLLQQAFALTFPQVRFGLPEIFAEPNGTRLLTPTCEQLELVRRKVVEQFHLSKNRQRRQSEGRRYVVYDRPKKEKKKKKQKCPSGNGISSFTFLNFVMGSISIAANIIDNINSNNNDNNNNNNNNNNNIGKTMRWCREMKCNTDVVAQLIAYI